MYITAVQDTFFIIILLKGHGQLLHMRTEHHFSYFIGQVRKGSLFKRMTGSGKTPKGLFKNVLILATGFVFVFVFALFFFLNKS